MNSASILLGVLAALGGTSAQAFDYLEHSYFSDRACRQAQDVLANELNADQIERYLALAIVCPTQWKGNYCGDGWKLLPGLINLMEKPPAESGGVSLTLGDFAALPDHLSRFGPVRGIPQAREEGLLTEVVDWLTEDSADSGAGGVVADVSEDACETDQVPWQRVEEDISEELKFIKKRGLVSPPQALLAPVARSPVPRGPHDPAGLYSFDNPHFLDKVLRDADHFGEKGFLAWQGFHQTSMDLANARCEELEDGDWKGKCVELRASIAKRLSLWAALADPRWVAPVRELIQSGLTPARLDRISSAVISLVFEGAGLHYLEDIFSAGHLRAVHDRRGLGERRYDHDRDNADGVTALLSTEQGEHSFVAFGDSYLLGPSLTKQPLDCDFTSTRTRFSPDQWSDCIIRHQRGLLVQVASDSVLEWARSAGPRGSALPTQAPRSWKTLPTPVPPFHYESLAFHLSADAVGRGNQLGLDVALYSELGSAAGWLTSHRMGFRTLTGENDRSRISMDYAYGFHWRWAARFIVDGEPFVFVGIKNTTPNRTWFAGLGPKLGITVLPEGWVKIPLELSLSYRLPLQFPKMEIEAHWIQASLGLAFM